jgi:hypothetical protein
LEITSKSPGPLPSLLPPRARGTLLCSPAAGSAAPLAAASPPPQRHLLLRSFPRVALFLSRSSSSSLVASRVRWPPPPRRRGELTTGLNFQSLACNGITPTSTSYCSSSRANSERSTHTPPPPSPLAPATHGTPVGSQHQTLSAPINPCASFPVVH